MDKLLMLGDDVHTAGIIKRAHEMGFYTILSDNRSVAQSPSKLLADEYWDISVKDIDLLETKAGEEGITAVLCGASEVCQSSVRLLCKRLDLPFWVGDKAWEITNDKSRFKNLCRECGLPVAKEYKLDISFKDEELSKIEYPVVVKPVDSCSGIGFHVCHDEEELKSGYLDAYEHSEKKSVMVEQYFTGMEVSLIYMFYDGQPRYLASFDSFGDRKRGRLAIFGAEPTICPIKFETIYENSFKKLFAAMECREGIGFVQILYDGNETAVMEMNYRLPGSRFFLEGEMIEHVLDSAVLGYTGDKEETLFVEHQTFIYFVWLKVGKIGRVEGIDRITDEDFFLSMSAPKRVGDLITENSGMKQIFSGIVINAQEDRVPDIIDFINESIIVEDDNGNDMVYRYRYEDIKPSFFRGKTA